MTITNCTPVTLTILSEKLMPNESRNYQETMFDLLTIHSPLGSCIVIKDYEDMFLKSFGKLVIKSENNNLVVST